MQELEGDNGNLDSLVRSRLVRCGWRRSTLQLKECYADQRCSGLSASRFIGDGEIRCQFIILARKDELTPDYALFENDELTPGGNRHPGKNDELTPDFPLAEVGQRASVTSTEATNGRYESATQFRWR